MRLASFVQRDNAEIDDLRARNALQSSNAGQEQLVAASGRFRERASARDRLDRDDRNVKAVVRLENTDTELPAASSLRPG